MKTRQKTYKPSASSVQKQIKKPAHLQLTNDVYGNTRLALDLVQRHLYIDHYDHPLSRLSCDDKLEFCKFMLLKAKMGDLRFDLHDGQKFHPTPAVDEVWHAFLLSPSFYAKFCEDIAGELIEHHPIPAKQDAPYTEAVSEMSKLFHEDPAPPTYWNPIVVKSLTGKTIVVENAGNVPGMMRIIHAKEGIPPAQQRLLYQSRQFSATDDLSEIFGNADHPTVTLVLRLRGC